MANLGGSSFTSGAVSAGVNQAVQTELAKLKDPQLRLIASAIVGATAARIVGGNAQAGASTAASGTKNNDYVHKPTTEGAIIYVPGEGFYKIVNGEDEYMENQTLPAGTIFWWQDTENNGGTKGWEYEAGDGGRIEDHEVDVKWTFDAFGKTYARVDDHGYKLNVKLRGDTQEYANGVIFLGSGYSGSSLAGDVGNAAKGVGAAVVGEKVIADAGEAAAAARAAEEAAAAARAAEEASAAARAAEEAAAAAQAASKAGSIDLQLFASKSGSASSVPKSIGNLTDGMRMETNAALDEASNFLGQGYKDMGNGRFVSADGTRQVRMGDSDILGNHAGGPHINFEMLEPNPARPDKMIPTTVLHIFIE